MMLLPRFYNLIEDAQSNLIDIDREAKYISYNETEMQDMNVLTCKETKSTFIKIKNKLYFRYNYDLLNETFRSICKEENFINAIGHIVFKVDTKDLDVKYDCYNDLYYLFDSFKSFEDWFCNNDVSVLLRLYKHTKVNIDEHKDIILNFIRTHFEVQDGNIFLLKIKFDEDTLSDFFYNMTDEAIEKKKNRDEYLRAMDDEICGDVYYYHNEINDKIDLYTVGCEISEWDGEKISYMINPEELDEEIILVNTCAVTEFAQSGSEKLAERLRKLYPNKKIYFLGCGVNYNKEYYSKLGIALTNQEKFNITNYGVTDNNYYNNYRFSLNQHRDVGMVKIEDGCYNNCAYCIIHKIRPHYMMPYEKIYKQIRELLYQGKKTIQLIGTEICSYKSDGMNLTTLCERILKDFPELSGLVLGALDPASKQIDSLINLIKKEPRVYNVLYLCTQSCSDEILRRMNRRHNVDRLREINRLAGDDVHLVFQLILGFPGETDELFQETIDVIKELKPVDYDAIVFSPRKGTPAYDMPDRVPTEVTDRRERIVYDLIKSYTFENNQNTNRSFAQYEQNGSNNFVKYKPDLSKSVVFYEDLYDTNAVIKLFDTLKNYENESKDIVIVTNFDLSRDLFDLDVNIKLLTSKFGVKVVTKFLIDDDVMNFISHTYWIPNVIMYRIGTYMEFDFKKLERTTKEDVIKLFKTSYLYKIDDTDLMAMRLLKAGNHELFKIIVEHFEGSL